MNLDVVETAAAPHAALAMPDQDAEHGPVANAAPIPTPPAPPPPPAPVTTVEPSLPDTAPAVAATEPASEAQSQTATPWPTTPLPIEAILPSPEPEAQAPDDTGSTGDDEVEQPSAEAPESGDGPKGHGGGKGKPGDKGHAVADHADDRNGADDDGEVAAKGHASPHAARSASDDRDVSYPPVGSLLASADVLYPEHDRGATQGALRELAAVLLDDGIIDHGLLDADAASDAPPAHQDRGIPAPAHQEPIPTVHEGNDVAMIGDFHGGFDQDGDDALVDSSGTLPPHNADL
jgi:hypothetical protein